MRRTWPTDNWVCEEKTKGKGDQKKVGSLGQVRKKIIAKISFEKVQASHPPPHFSLTFNYEQESRGLTDHQQRRLALKTSTFSK